jgi:tyrosyl-tRNA synthetase
VIRLTSKFTVAQFLARDDFAKRYAANQPIAISELLYPLLQAYDSVVVEADVEFGGMDQKFNLLVGRDMQQMMGQAAQQLLLVPLLPGTDGVQKMSKSLGNYIGIDEPPNEIFGKTMSLPDDLIALYFEYLTDVPDSDLAEMRSALGDRSVNPMELKKKLAGDLVTQFHSSDEARSARGHFESTVQRGGTPEDVETHVLPPTAELEGRRLGWVLVQAGMAPSAAEARRLIAQNAVEIDGETAANVLATTLPASGLVKVGRRRYARVVRPDI